MSGIQGQVLRMSQRREAAIYLRKGTLWVADFIDGDGEIVEATTWFRFNCGALSAYHARRRMVRESAIPLSSELVNRIETLHRPTRQRRTIAQWRRKTMTPGRPGREARSPEFFAPAQASSSESRGSGENGRYLV